MASASRPRNQAHSRTVFLLLLHRAQGKYTPVYLGPIAKYGTTIGELVEMLAKAQQATNGPNPFSEWPPIGLLEKVRFFDWALDEHFASIGVVAFPAPGVIIGLYGEGIESDDVLVDLIRLKLDIEKLPIVTSFINSPDSRFTPTTHYNFDIFLSYSSKDSALAIELRQSLESKGASVFIAEQSINVGDKWNEEVRNAIRGARLLVLLLTPSSVASVWVLIECGAAWVLDIPIAIALDQVPAAKLPDALATYQYRNYETNAQRAAFVEEVERLLSKAELAN